MNLPNISRFVALLATGLLAGIFFGGRMGPSMALPLLPPASFVTFQQRVHAYFVRFMPPLQILAVLGSLTWLYSLRAEMQSAAFLLVAVGVAGAISVFAMTLAVNVPINKKLMTWNPAAPPPDLRDIWAPWERVNSIRTVLSMGAFTLELIAMSLSA